MFAANRPNGFRNVGFLLGGHLAPLPSRPTTEVCALLRAAPLPRRDSTAMDRQEISLSLAQMIFYQG